LCAGTKRHAEALSLKVIARHYAGKRERKQTQTELFNLSPGYTGLHIVILLTPFHMLGKPATLHFARQQDSASQMYEKRTIRYKKGRPCRCNRGEREVDSSGDFAPRPPRFNALVPVRKLGTGKTGSVADPASVPAPGSALGLLLSRALSSAQAEAIVAKRKRRGKQWSECVRRPTSGRLPRQEYGQPFNETALNPEGSVVQ
jgi:hypothetical protein